VTCAEPGLTLRFTLTGLDPGTSDAALACGATLNVEASATVKVRAWRGQDASAVTRGDFVITGMLAAGRAHSLALAADGRVWAWGDNMHGQLGLGGTADSATPQRVPGLTDIVAIVAGDNHSLALKRDGSAWAWGAGGQLGDGSSVASSVPVAVSTSAALVGLAAGSDHSLARRLDGTLLAWGHDEGAFGNGTATLGSLTPVPAAAGLAGLRQIDAGDGFSLALDAQGGVWAWGDNTDGTLGDGSTTPSPTPLAVPDLGGVTRLAAGQVFSLAQRNDGAERAEAWSWGFAWFGGSRPRRILADAVDVGAGAYHALALGPGGHVWAWGEGSSGQLGDGGLATVETPQLVPGLAGIVAVTGGAQHTLALHADGSVWAWGDNTDGQLGDGSTNQRTVPVRLAGLELASGAWASADPDGDGLSSAAEQQLGSDPFDPDTNGDGLRDGDAAALGLSLVHPDMDADGLPNRAEIAAGTDPFDPDTDGDGVRDGLDAFPLDPGRWEPPPPDPGDHTPPTIVLLQPAGAVLLSSTP
jgi:alpha-tubulin suppressor-like RCC1 family protein